MKNKKAIIGLGALAVMLFGVASSIAYLTDTDTTVNVMTVGNVKIEQLEYERVLDENGKATSELQPYSQLKPIVPAVYKTENKNAAWADGYQTWESIGAPGSNQLFHEGVKNVIDKFVFVENTGKKDAYYRTIIALEAPEGLSDGALHTSLNGTNYFDYNADEDGVQNAAYSNKFYTTINGTRYLVYTATYTRTLTPGEISRPSFLQVFLDPQTTNEDVEKFDDTFEILAISQAVQADGFDNPYEALEEAFGKVTEAKVSEWFGGLTVVVENGTEEEMSEQISDALQNGQNVVVDQAVDIVTVNPVVEENGVSTYDSNGATVTMNGEGAGNYGYLAFIPEAGEDANVKNLNVTGSGFVEIGHYGMGGGDYTAENLTIKDLTTTLAITDGAKKLTAAFAHYGTATLKNCVMTGTVSGRAGYQAYDAGFVNKTTTTVDGGEYGSMYIWSQAHVTIKNAKVGTIDTATITTKNLGMLTIGAGAVVDTINVIPAGTYTPALTIEDGATVGKIVYKGNTYTVEQWKALSL